MSWILLLLFWFLCAFTPIYYQHDNQRKTDDEFTNVYGQAQSRNFKVYTSTPNLTDVQDGEAVIVSTTSYVKFMFRQGQEVYSVNVSCVTVRR